MVFKARRIEITEGVSPNKRSPRTDEESSKNSEDEKMWRGVKLEETKNGIMESIII